MIHHAWTVLCARSLIDRDTNNISLDVLEQLNVQIPPPLQGAGGFVLPARLEVVSLWFRAAEDEGA